MPSRTILERQLKLAVEKLARVTKSLDDAGVAAAAHTDQPKWRAAAADCRQLRMRLRAVAAIEANNALVTARANGEVAAE